MVAALVAGLALVSPPHAAAVPPLAVTSATNVRVEPDSTTTLSGLVVSGGDPTDTLQVTVATSVGTLTLPETTGLMLSYANHASGDPSITFTGVESAIDAALASAQLVTGDDAGSTAAVSLTAMVAQPDYFYLASTGHFYHYVAQQGISWTDADAAAQAQTFAGQAGYLVTIPNNDVNDFIASKIQGAENIWIGAYSDDTPDDPIARTWRWSAGPRAGQAISYCTNFMNLCDFTNNTGLYSHWATGEPNNSDAVADTPHSGEWAAVTNWSNTIGVWNDLPSSWPSQGEISGYIVEYGDRTVGSTGFAGVASASSDVQINSVPDAPTDVSAARGNGTATASFTAPEDNGSAITDYAVTASPGGATATCAASPCTVTGLTNGTSYTLSVTATNGVGTGPASSDSNAVTPATVPGAPTAVTATVGDAGATVSFSPPADDGEHRCWTTRSLRARVAPSRSAPTAPAASPDSPTAPRTRSPSPPRTPSARAPRPIRAPQ